MFISLNWLKDFVELSNKVKPEEVGGALTAHTVEVEGLENQSKKYNGVVVGKILEVGQHPNADRLRLAKVDVGGEKLDIVCGAPNIEAGQMVPVAVVGVSLPGGLKIAKTKIRGEESSGMLCAEDELGLGENHDGIMILGEDAKIGQSFSQYLHLSDVVLEIDNKSLSNRPDLWCHRGIAREVATLFDSKFIDYKPGQNTLKAKSSNKIKVTVKDQDLCPRYMAIEVNNIKIGESPEWMQERLLAVGMRSINNIVDITNYVMLELGQPLHAFDKKLVDEIVVRRAKDKEKINTLDGEERELDRDMLVIADSHKPVAVAGVMGGENSEVDKSTEAIIIESANFDFVSVRKTSNKLGLRTESSMRFEKCLDPNLCEEAIARTVELILEIIPEAKINSKLSDVKKFKLNIGPISISTEWINSFMGVNLKEAEIVKILKGLGFKTSKKEKEILVTIPTWRVTRDISIAEDIAEEVVRIYGFDNIPEVYPTAELVPPYIDPMKTLERKLVYIVKGEGFCEVYNYSFVGVKQLTKLDINSDEHIELKNPISSNQSLLRGSLAPNLLENVKTNQSRFNKIKFFEIGRVFLTTLTGESTGYKNEKLFKQDKHLSLVIASGGQIETMYTEAKELIGILGSEMGIEFKFEKNNGYSKWGVKDFSTKVVALDKKTIVGFINVLNARVKNRVGLKKDVVVLEINLEILLKIINGLTVKRYEEIDKYPAVERDIALVMSKKVSGGELSSFILDYHELITSVKYFDSHNMEDGTKSLAFHVRYQADRTLTADEVDVFQTGLIQASDKNFGANLSS